MPRFLLASVCLLWANSVVCETRILGELGDGSFGDPVSSLGDTVVKRVSGAFGGDWGDDIAPPDTENVKYVYVIVGKSWVPAESSLTIHGGVTVQLEWSETVDIYGGFQANGTAQNPIYVRALQNAQGFRFEGEASDTVSLSHVYFSDSPDSIPEIALTSAGRSLCIDTCRIWAQAIAVRCTDAKASIIGSTITKMRAGNAAIKLDNAEGSELTADTVKVWFSTSVFNLFTHGIHLVGSQNATISGSVVTAEGEGAAVGICAERHCSFLNIDNSAISVECENYTWPRGIWLPTAGYCTISNSSVSVRSKNSDQATLSLSGSTSAQVFDSYLYLGGDAKGHFICYEGNVARCDTQRVFAQREPQRAPFKDRDAEINRISMGTVFPNPFNVVTQLPIELSRASIVEIVVFDILGHETDRISCGELPGGRHLVPLSGAMWASGAYFVSLIVDGEPVAQQRIVLVK